MQSDHANQNRPENERFLRVQVIPDLSVTVESAPAVEVDIFSAELEEGGCVLVDLLEGVLLPVVCVISKLDLSLDLCRC